MGRAGVGERFPRAARVRRRPDYLAIQNRGRRVAGSHLLLFALPGGGRIGITVSKKVGGAVLRNRVKRWIRDCYRRRRPEFPPGYDLVVVARPPAARADHAVVCGELTSLVRRLGGTPSKDVPPKSVPSKGASSKGAP
ncbi:MAG TPA: ribonuclease P protein component [Polyangia bacterium]|nr:ribonuclease P protein component [Polyangia bacterium]